MGGLGDSSDEVFHRAVSLCCEVWQLELSRGVDGVVGDEGHVVVGAACEVGSVDGGGGGAADVAA